MAAAVREPSGVRNGEKALQPPTSSSHRLILPTLSPGTRSLQGAPPFPPYPAEQKKGKEQTQGQAGPARQSAPPVPGIAPGAGDTVAKRINKAWMAPEASRPPADFLRALEAALSLTRCALMCGPWPCTAKHSIVINAVLSETAAKWCPSCPRTCWHHPTQTDFHILKQKGPQRFKDKNQEVKGSVQL